MFIKSEKYFLLLLTQHSLTCEESTWPAVALPWQQSITDGLLLRWLVAFLPLAESRILFEAFSNKLVKFNLYCKQQWWVRIPLTSPNLWLSCRSECLTEALVFASLLFTPAIMSFQGPHEPPCRAGSAKGSLSGYQTGRDFRWYSKILYSNFRNIGRLLCAILWYSQGSVDKNKISNSSQVGRVETVRNRASF